MGMPSQDQINQFLSESAEQPEAPPIEAKTRPVSEVKPKNLEAARGELTPDQAAIQQAKQRQIHLGRSCMASILNDHTQTLLSIAQTEIVHCGAFYDVREQVLFLILGDLQRESKPLDLNLISTRLSETRTDDALARAKLTDKADSPESDLSVRRALRLVDKRDIKGEFNALEWLGGITYLLELMEIAHTKAKGAFAENCRNLWQGYLRQRTIKQIEKQLTKIKRGEGSLDKGLEVLSDEVLRIQKAGAVAGPETLGAAIQIARSNRDAVADKDGSVGHRTHIDVIDKRLGGLRSANLTIIAARPACGKTSFVLHLCRNILSNEEKKSILFFNLEMQKEELVNKLIAAEANIDSRTTETGNLSNEEAERLIEAETQIASWNMHIDDSSRQTVKTIRSKTRRHIAEFPETKIVVIDYLQLISAEGRQSEYERITETSRELKIIGSELDVCIIALCQLSRPDKKAAAKEPDLSDLRGSGQIEQDGGLIMFLHMVEGADGDKTRKLMLKVAKNRYGPTARLGALFHVTTGRFDVTHRPREEAYKPTDETMTEEEAMQRHQEDQETKKGW